jgi:hypothetical protein
VSRLDAFIERMQAQRACIGAARALVRGLPGPVLELGLGNGRTYDHLRATFPDRAIFVFERQPAPHPDCMPDPAHLVVGDLRDTLPEARRLLPLGEGAAFAHSDIGTADPSRNARVAAWLAGALPPLLRAGGVVASDQRLDGPGLEPLPLPEGVAEGRYFLYRRAATMARLPGAAGTGG